VTVLRQLKKRCSSDEKALGMHHTVKWEMTSAVSPSHILLAVNLILAPHYWTWMSMTTSGKGRRSACVEHYRQDALERLEFSV
jgi:hypothetical protein